MGMTDTQPLDCGLYVVATPIGNLMDMTFRAVDVLKQADLIACEDTRVTGKLLKHYGIETPMIAYNDHNGAKVRPKLLAHLQAGRIIALVSDAGTPLISDPGYKLVQACATQSIKVSPVPGASALLAGLVTAGLPTDRVMFAGFLPPKETARRTHLAPFAAIEATLVFYESGPRLAESLADMAAVLGPRPAAVARELTKLYEDVRRGPLDQLATAYGNEAHAKGEIVVIIGPPDAPEMAAADIDNALREAMVSMSVRDAAADVAALSGRPRRTLYARALELRDSPPSPTVES